MILGEVRGRGARRERQTNKKAAKQKEAGVRAGLSEGVLLRVLDVYPTSGGNSVSFGVPMRRDSCTSQGLQPWLISTSDCTDMYM